MLFESLAAHKNLVLLFSTLAVCTTSTLLLALLRLAQILPIPQPLPSETSTSEAQSQSEEQDDHQLSSPSIESGPTHLLIVLGSGGHTAEMLNILSTLLPGLPRNFTHRTYLISSGDSFSAQKAVEFEESLSSTTSTLTSLPTSELISSASTIPSSPTKSHPTSVGTYTIATVHRARRVHQSWLSTPYTTLLSLRDCMAVLRGTHQDLLHHTSHPSSSPTQPNSKFNRDPNTHSYSHYYPDLILTNGPGTGVCVVVASLILRFFGYSPPLTSTFPSASPSASSPQTKPDQKRGRGEMRTIFIESWARVKSLSLSGKILRPMVNRFLVQWPQLVDILEMEEMIGGGAGGSLGIGVGARVEYVGALVS